MASLNKLMKQAMRAQQQAEQVQAELAERTVEASSGGGAVKVVARCDGSVQSIKVDPEALSPDDAEMLEDMLLSAVNSAISEGQEIQKNEMAKITSGMGLPGMGMCWPSRCRTRCRRWWLRWGGCLGLGRDLLSGWHFTLCRARPGRLNNLLKPC